MCDIDEHVLSTGCPGTENLKMRFARSLRVNYQQLGNADAVNKAIAVELEATRVHLEKSWRSNESYYRRKYAGAQRALQLLRWIQFITLDWIWGNGESVGKLLRAALVVILVIAGLHMFVLGSPRVGASYVEQALEAPAIFLGVEAPTNYPKLYLTVIVFVPGSCCSGRRRCNDRNAVSNDEGVIADQDVFDDEPHDSLPFHDIERVGRVSQSCQKSCESLG